MLRAPSPTNQPRRRAIHLAAAAIGLVTAALVWWLLKPSAAEQHDLFAMVRGQGLFDGERPGRQEQVLADLLSEEVLTSAMRQSRFAAADAATSDEVPAVEDVRAQLRIEVGQADNAGMQAVTIRWIGTSSPAAARLTNLLGRRLLNSARAAGGSDGQAVTPAQIRQSELTHATARQAMRDADQAQKNSLRHFKTALAEMHLAERAMATSPSPALDDSDEAELPPPGDSELNGAPIARQQLADLESQRQELAQRLMPEHPEMKAVEEKILALQSRLAQQPPPVRHLPPLRPVRIARPSPSKPVQQAAAQLAQRADELAAAEAQYASAAVREHAACQSLCAAKNHTLAIFEPARIAPAPAGQTGVTVVIAALCGLLSSAVATLAWPVRRLTFSTVEEVRAVTRLPVIALSRHSLN